MRVQNLIEQMKKQVCIIGCGTFGSYLTKRFLEKWEDQIALTVIEIGNHHIQTESQVGLDAISEHSKVSRDGRYFGFGGTSARWGGQVLFFDERDNPTGDLAWQEIVRINARHKDTVLEKLLGKTGYLDLCEEDYSIKTGIWLKYAKRNMFKRFSHRELKKLKLLPNQRVVGFKMNGRQVTAVVCKSKSGDEQEVQADVFYLTAGALESCRLLLSLNEKTGLLNGSDLGKNFGDHISTELFTVHGAKPLLSGVDFTPRLHRGSLVTRRMIVTTEEGAIGFVHTVFNKDIRAFKFLKELLFGKRTTTVTFTELLSGAAFLFKFGFYLLFMKKLYVDKGQWSVQLDMEQPVPNNNELRLSARKDRYGEAALRIDWEISAADRKAIESVRREVEQLLRKNRLNYQSLYNPASTTNKVEDVYHPVGCLRAGYDSKAVTGFDGQVKNLENLYHFSTGIFPSAKSINPSAAVMCHIEEHLLQWGRKF